MEYSHLLLNSLHLAPIELYSLVYLALDVSDEGVLQYLLDTEMGISSRIGSRLELPSRTQSVEILLKFQGVPEMVLCLIFFHHIEEYVASDLLVQHTH